MYFNGIKFCWDYILQVNFANGLLLDFLRVLWKENSDFFFPIKKKRTPTKRINHSALGIREVRNVFCFSNRDMLYEKQQMHEMHLIRNLFQSCFSILGQAQVCTHLLCPGYFIFKTTN